MNRLIGQQIIPRHVLNAFDRLVRSLHFRLYLPIGHRNVSEGVSRVAGPIVLRAITEDTGLLIIVRSVLAQAFQPRLALVPV